MWVVDMDKKLDDAESSAKVAKWPKHCIFRVPPRFKMVVDGKVTSVYKPQTVALGPFHHGDADLEAMEEHKLRAVRHLLRRAGKTLGELVAAMEEVADELEDAYMGLSGEWRGENRGRFLEMMITDGCFLLEVMRTAAARHPIDCVKGDPVFSKHGIEHIQPFVQRDMLMLENQLPLRVLQRILTVETGEPPNDGVIHDMVLNFLCPEGCDPRNVAGGGLGLHPLDVYRRSLVKRPGQAHRGGAAAGAGAGRVDPDVPRSAQKLTDAGIRFRTNKQRVLIGDIDFDGRRRKLLMPRVTLDDSTPYKYHNMMAFEAMHVGTSNDVTAYVLFMKDIIDSADDVRLLRRKRILDHDLAGDDEAVVKMFNTLTKDVSKNWDSELCDVRKRMEKHYKHSRMRWLVYEPWAGLKNKYFRSPWTSIALFAALLLVLTDIIQTVYAFMTYELEKSEKKNSTTMKW